jgi:hypothetical protein
LAGGLLGHNDTVAFTGVRSTSADVRRGARAAGLLGLLARGVLYATLAVLALDLVVGERDGRDVDARGAMDELARQGVGALLLGLLVLGFIGFALWHAFEAFVGRASRDDGGERALDALRAVVYGGLGALAISILVAAERDGDTDRQQQSWTADVLGWPGGRLLVGAIGLVVIGVGLVLAGRALSGGEQESRAVRDAAPHETPLVHTLAVVGNLGRGAVLLLVGVFVVSAAVEYDASETAGLDGALKRLLDEPYGDVLVLGVAVALGAFAVSSIARAVVNLHHVAHEH